MSASIQAIRDRSAEQRLAPFAAALAANLAARGEAGRALHADFLGPLTAARARELFVRAPRLLGKARAEFTDPARSEACMPVDDFTVDLLGRVVLIAQLAAQCAATELDDWLSEAYRHGEQREREAVLRALALLPDAARHEPLAADACRNNVVPVFAAITCDNPYPALYFAPETFRQMVLKAIFVELPIARIMGLEQRLDPELARMARDYASERRAAGRSIPEDAAWLASRGDTQ